MKAKEMIKMHEGYSSTVYDCPAGKPTIGFGRNLERGITLREAEYLLDNDIQLTKNSLCCCTWWDNLNEVRKDAVIDMTYNLGITRLLKFKKMITAIKAKNFTLASAEMLDSKWAFQVGNRAITLAELMRTGKWLK
jgi:lysozyme